MGWSMGVMISRSIKIFSTAAYVTWMWACISLYIVTSCAFVLLSRESQLSSPHMPETPI